MQINFDAAAALPSGAFAGIADGDQIAALQKALTAGYGTDVAQLSGGAALRIQSLDRLMAATIQEEQHFKLFNALAKAKVGSTVHEWTEQSAVGGFLGGSTNTETGTIAEATGTYNRRTAQVKYLMTRRGVSVVQTLQNAIADAEVAEQRNGALQLLTDAEYLCFEGDASVVPTEFDGINAQMVAGVNTGQVDGGNIIDVQAASLSSIEPLNAAAMQVSKFGNFGTPSHLFVPQGVQADFDNSLQPAFRVALANVPGGGTQVGAPVVGIRTSYGDIAMANDVLIREGDQKQPFEVVYPVIAAAQVGLKPASVAVDASVSDVSSMFKAAWAGNYYYLVTGVNASGQSTGLVSSQVAIAAGKRATLTITRSAGAQETGYVIYRSRLNGGNAVAGSVVGQGSDFREMVRVPVAGATTIWADLNREIPGTSKAFVLNMRPGADAIAFRQMLPMTKFPLAMVSALVIPWAQAMFGFLQIKKRRHHVVIKNILPTGAVWRPFN